MKLRKLNIRSLSLAILIGLMALTLTACAPKTAQTTSSGVEGTPKISFDPCSGSEVLTAEIGKDGTVALPKNPTWKSDYTFMGWYADKGYTTEFKNSGLSTEGTVYAKWAASGKTVRTEILNLYYVTKDTGNKEEGWEWNEESRTLTLSGLTIDTEELDKDGSSIGLVFPKCPNDPDIDDALRHGHTKDCPSNTLILTEGTVNTMDCSRARNGYYSATVYSSNALTVKSTDGNTPGKLNVTAAPSKDVSIAIYNHGDLTLLSGDISATANSSKVDISAGIQATLGRLYIKGGKITATGGTCESMPADKAAFGSYGLKGTLVQIDDGTVTATGGTAKNSLSAGVLGMDGLKLNGGSITAKGETAAVASFKTLTNDGTTVSGVAAKISEVKDVDPNKNVLHTFVDEEAAIIKEISVKS